MISQGVKLGLLRAWLCFSRSVLSFRGEHGSTETLSRYARSGWTKKEWVGEVLRWQRSRGCRRSRRLEGG